MGCCQSREVEDQASSGAATRGGSPTGATNEEPDAAGAGNNPPNPTAPRLPHPQQSDAASNTRRVRSHPRRIVTSQPVPLGEHYNLPIRPHLWRSKRRTWNPVQLAREREEFFDTRVTGRPEVWSALSAATVLIRDGDITTAQSIIDAAGVTVPTGDLCEGCYDENGVFYRLPEAIVADPTNIVDAPEQEEEDKYQPSGCLEADEGSGSKLQTDYDSDEQKLVERSHEEKGKLKKRDCIKVPTRLSDRGSDLIITIGKEQTVGLLARKVQHEAGLTGQHRVRIAYLGKMLNENEPLLSQGWRPGRVVNALVANLPSN